MIYGLCVLLLIVWTCTSKTLPDCGKAANAKWIDSFLVRPWIVAIRSKELRLARSHSGSGPKSMLIMWLTCVSKAVSKAVLDMIFCGAYSIYNEC